MAAVEHTNTNSSRLLVGVRCAHPNLRLPS